MINKMVDFYYEKVLGCRFSFEACVKNVNEKVTKWSLKTTKALVDTDGHVLA